jgi:hypothetical protein
VGDRAQGSAEHWKGGGQQKRGIRRSRDGRVEEVEDQDAARGSTGSGKYRIKRVKGKCRIKGKYRIEGK